VMLFMKDEAPFGFCCLQLNYNRFRLVLHSFFFICPRCIVALQRQRINNRSVIDRPRFLLYNEIGLSADEN
ncbi:MAG: hypothetical protein PHI27_12515, partial [Eubacteriales bacterium]|nr:hypothetical protein [Eubacteriales bacterium]MDD4513597.1 hypothetical protein [Eubacteriales bacterium]